MCKARLQAVKPRLPSPRSPSRAGPCWRLGRAQGSACARQSLSRALKPRLCTNNISQRVASRRVYISVCEKFPITTVQFFSHTTVTGQLYTASKYCKRAILDAMTAQTTTASFGPLVYLFCSFLVFMNWLIMFLGSKLLVATDADMTQPDGPNNKVVVWDVFLFVSCFYVFIHF